MGLATAAEPRLMRCWVCWAITLGTCALLVRVWCSAGGTLGSLFYRQHYDVSDVAVP